MNSVYRISTLLFTIVLGASHGFARTWGTETHGGDGVVQDFIRYGQNLEVLFPFVRTKIISAAQLTSLKAAIDSAKISSEDTVAIDGQELDAINNPTLHTIVVNRKRWLQEKSETHLMRSSLALHEYLWLSGVDDTNYRVSNAFQIDLINARNLRAKSPISAGLRNTLCAAIITRDHQTIEMALEMGADLEGACGSVDYTCPEGTTDYNNGNGTDDKSGIMDGPIAMAIRNMGDRNLCSFPVSKEPMDDQEMVGILKTLLSYHPDLKRRKGPDSFASYAAQTGKGGLVRLLTKAGGDPQDGFIAATEWGSHASSVAEDELEEYVAMGADMNAALPETLEPSEVPTILSSALLRYCNWGTSPAFIDFLAKNHKIDFCKFTRARSAKESMRVGDAIYPDYLPIVKKYSPSCVP